MRLLLAALLALLLAAAPARAELELKLATWNIAWLTFKPAGHPDLPRDVTPRRPEDIEALRRYAARLEADVIALQEVDGPLAAARVFDERAYHILFADEDDVQRTGFAIRRTLKATRNPDLMGLDLVPEARRSLRRGADVTVETPGGSKLRLLSIHLGAGCREGSLAAPNSRECDRLARQLPPLAGWIAERRREGVAFAILGDFNRRLRPNDDFLRPLEAAAPLTRATDGASSPCWAERGDGRPFIDHILLGGAARGWMVAGSLRVLVFAERDRAARDRISDHCPVSVRLRLPG